MRHTLIWIAVALMLAGAFMLVAGIGAAASGSRLSASASPWWPSRPTEDARDAGTPDRTANAPASASTDGTLWKGVLGSGTHARTV